MLIADPFQLVAWSIRSTGCMKIHTLAANTPAADAAENSSDVLVEADENCHRSPPPTLASASRLAFPDSVVYAENGRSTQARLGATEGAESSVQHRENTRFSGNPEVDR